MTLVYTVFRTLKLKTSSAPTYEPRPVIYRVAQKRERNNAASRPDLRGHACLDPTAPKVL